MNIDSVVKLLKVLARHDAHDECIWTEDLDFAVLCNDFFWWGTADAVEFTEEGIDLLEQTFKDVAAIDYPLTAYAGLLWCARMRKMRPQGAYYKVIPRELWNLFDACGPEREIDMLNPHPVPVV